MSRLLFDEQLSDVLCTLLADVFPSALHIRAMGYERAPDELVWARATQHGCLVVSKDDHFHRMALLRGALLHPIWTAC